MPNRSAARIGPPAGRTLSREIVPPIRSDIWPETGAPKLEKICYKTAISMDPKLEAISGPLEGSAFPLSNGDISIGREPSNAISILDSSVSRRHCLIQKVAEQFRIKDLESRNSTLVNGVPIQERLLEDGDEIKVGNSVFVFLAASPVSGSAVELHQRELTGGSTIVLRKEEAVYLKPKQTLVALPATTRLVRDLNALLAVSRAVNSIRSLEGLERRILECVFEVAPADRAAILLAGETAGQFLSVYGWDRHFGPDRPVEVSHTVVSRVLEEGVSVVSNDVGAAEDFGSAKSLMAPQVQAVLAVPLTTFGRVQGVLYLDASDPAARFDEELLQLMTGIGSIAAVALENARHVEWLEGENRRLQVEINIEHDMVGESPAMREVYQFINKVAGGQSTVLVYGESGTGKELVARAIHRNSSRAVHPFVAINCAALTETLLESELFGHERGAFTGAVSQKKGKLELAEDGTAFLDEIGELAPSLQAKLLRVLQEREIERVGGTRTIRLNIRLITATNRDLKEAVRAGTFREDLYYRLNVVSLRMPPLRERREDIPPLASHFAAKYGAKAKRTVRGISPEARACLLHYDWPGNVRELENALERAVVLGSTELLLPEDLPEAVLERAAPDGAAGNGGFHDGVREAKKRLILEALEQAGGTYTEAAKLLGVHPNYLHRLIKNLDLKPKQARQASTGSS